MTANTTGTQNTAVGSLALTAVTARYNTAVGYNALLSLTTGEHNTALGQNSGTVLITGSDNIFLGNSLAASSSSVSDEYVIGHNLTGGGTETTTIGSDTDSIVNDWGENATWTHSSDKRMKNVIGDSPLGLEFISKLSSKMYTKKPAKDWPKKWGVNPEAKVNTKVKLHGLLAQDVKKAMTDLGVENFGGHAVDKKTGRQRVGQSAFVYPLINAVNELKNMVDDLKSQIEELKNGA